MMGRGAEGAVLPDVLIVSKRNNYGLTRDAAILADALRAAGAQVALADINDRGFLARLGSRKEARQIVHLERAHPRWFGAAAEETILIPNQERFPRRQLRLLRRVDRVLAKSRHGAAIFSGLGVETQYLGFSSEDRRESSVRKDWRRFFHLAGGSTLKGTEEVLALWRGHPEWPELVLVQKAANAPREVPANVRLIAGYMDDAELRWLQNGCGIHLCPSRSEGWGHHIIEAMSCGAVVVTTDAAPMNENVDAASGVLVEAGRSEPRHLGTNFFVDRSALEKAVERLIGTDVGELAAMGKRARARYEDIAQGFRDRVTELLAHRS